MKRCISLSPIVLTTNLFDVNPYQLSGNFYFLFLHSVCGMVWSFCSQYIQYMYSTLLCSVHYLLTKIFWHIFFGISLLIWPRNTVSEWITSNSSNNGNLQQHSTSKIRTYAENKSQSCWNSSDTTLVNKIFTRA